MLSGSLISPGVAAPLPDVTVLCTTGSFTINSLNVVTGNTACAGVAIIPNSVTSIGNNAFAGLTGLTSVTIGNSVTSIGSSAFYGNTALTSVTIGNSVRTIGSDAFGGNTRLTSVTIPDSVITIGDDAFYGNTALTSVIIGNSVTSIGASAFSGNTTLTSVTIGNSVAIIGNSVFQGNTALTSVTIPDSVTNIGAGAFWNSNLLTSVTFLGIAALTDDVVGDVAFLGVAAGATANVAYNATGYPASGEVWNGLIVVYGSPPADDSGSDSSPTTKTITPVVVKVADSITNMKNKTYLSKYSMKLKLRDNNLFKYSASDSFKYQVFKSSKKSCGMRGNYVMRYENSKTCDLYVTRINAQGISNKYWVKINYTK